MSFSERRYETLSAGAPIFGIQAALWVETNALVPIIPNIGALCSVWVNHRHSAFRKTTCPPGSSNAGTF
jgi:hypothetical protein